MKRLKMELQICCTVQCTLKQNVYESRCFLTFRSYNTALVSICDSSLFGLILMLISAAASGFLFTVLVWCNSHTWIYFKHKGRYIKVRKKYLTHMLCRSALFSEFWAIILDRKCMICQKSFISSFEECENITTYLQKVPLNH